MTKTIITPENNCILLQIPEEYVGKRLEVLIYAIEESSDNNYKPVTMESFKGILTNEEQRYCNSILKIQENNGRQLPNSITNRTRVRRNESQIVLQNHGPQKK